MLNNSSNSWSFTRKIFAVLQLTVLLGASMLATNVLARDDGPCEPTKIISSNYFSRPASGVYACTIRRSSNGVITAWMWIDSAALLSSERYRQKYAFRCNPRLMQRLEDERSGLTHEDWSRPQKATTGDKWLNYICQNARFYR